MYVKFGFSSLQWGCVKTRAQPSIGGGGERRKLLISLQECPEEEMGVDIFTIQNVRE